MLGVATVAGFLSGRAYPGELAALFRIQYAVGLAVIVVVAAFTRRRSVALVATVLLLADVAAVSPAVVAAGRPDPQGPRASMIVVNVGSSDAASDGLAQLIRTEQPDVVGLVELTNAREAQLAEVLQRFRYHVSAPRPGVDGVGLYSRRPLAGARILDFGPAWPAAATATLVVGREPLRLFVVHPPTPIRRGSAERQRQYMEFLGQEASTAGGRALVCGDLNAAPWSGVYRDLLDRGGLEEADRWRPPAWTWPIDNLLLRTPIDQCAAGERVAVQVERGPEIGSDHLPLMVEAGPAP